MDKVFTEYYEIVDEGAEGARAYYAQYDAAADAQRAVAVELGGIAFQFNATPPVILILRDRT